MPDSPNEHQGNPAQPSGADKRRSGRIMLSVPLRAWGVDADGIEFMCAARTVSINRHGARIQVARRLAAGSALRLANLTNQTEGEFRIVGFLGTGSDGAEEWGVEAADSELDFWGIYFPPPPHNHQAPSALLECRECHTAGLLQLSAMEVEVLDAGTGLSRPCVKCGRETLWDYAEKAVPDEPAAPAAPRKEAPRRKDRRHYVQRPLTIRDASGNTDVTRTENVSKGGVCCTSERNYETGQEVTLSWPNVATGGNYEARARVVRRHDLGGSARRIYGFRYESPAILLPPPHRSARGLYWRFGTLVAAATALAGMAAFALAATLPSPSETWTPAAELAAVVLLLYLASRTRSAILRYEPEQDKRWQQRHHAAGALAASALAGVVAVSAAAGFRRGSERTQGDRLLNDVVLARTVEQYIDSTEDLNPVSSQDYFDACSTLDPLVRQWEPLLDDLAGDLADVDRIRNHDKTLMQKLSRLHEIIRLDQEKIRVVREQIALPREAVGVPPDQQLAFWRLNFDSLQKEFQTLNIRRDALVASFAGKP